MIKTDCAHFPLDRPCVFHKKSGVHCRGCGHFKSVRGDNRARQKILIIKLGAMGDVLRTTFLADGLKKKSPKSEITWLVFKESADILKGNPLIKRIWFPDKNILSKLAAEFFDVSINLDLAPESLQLQSLAQASKKYGFWLDGTRKIACSNSYAEKWLEMSAFDDKKKANRKTYQYWMSRIAGLPKSDYPICTPLSRTSRKKARAFARRHALKGKKVIGINPGAGRRWKHKKWTDKGYVKLIDHLHSKGYKVLLFGGPEEAGLVKKLISTARGKAVSAGTHNSIPDFFALLNLCDLVVTGDTLALHAALGLGKKVLAFFGPTSAPEIEMYGLGKKIVSPAKCVCCYLPRCGVKPDCMKRISPQTVIKAAEKLLKK
ncbi:MAG: glycosyltransferase family 9 protein [Endomicrobiales bacterium]|nr:glycosyltransferase family 9 protein [Endomicrobiales bacterium]